MKDLLHPSQRALLARFAQADTLLAFDFDGTLAPIVPDPRDARMRPGTHRLFAEVARRYPVAVISGRAQQDALARLAGIQLWSVTGNHGADMLYGYDAGEARVRSLASRLREAMQRFPGVEVEDKCISVSVHYRRAGQKRAALAELDRLLIEAGPHRRIGGKQVVNILPEGAPHKGTALECTLRWAGCSHAVYVGDDETDEDAFQLATDPHVLAVRVGKKRNTAATHFLPAQARIDALLAALLELRPAAVTRAAS
jgi:trehalose 6-phosphate phosphatase